MVPHNSKSDLPLGNIKNILPSTWYHQFLVILVGMLGALEILATFACVMYMPVSILENIEPEFYLHSIFP